MCQCGLPCKCPHTAITCLSLLERWLNLANSGPEVYDVPFSNITSLDNRACPTCNYSFPIMVEIMDLLDLFDLQKIPQKFYIYVLLADRSHRMDNTPMITAGLLNDLRLMLAITKANPPMKCA